MPPPMDDMSAAYYHASPSAATHHSYYPPPPREAPRPPYNRSLPPPPPPYQAHSSPPYSHHHPPFYGAAYSASSDHPSHDEVRTLFIAGLPDDVKPREIYNLFREFPGYQSAQLRNSGQSSQAYAFAVFTDQQSAVAAMHALNGLMFDLEKESALYIDLAKSNSRFKRSRTDDGGLYSSDRRVRGTVASSRGFSDSGAGSNTHMPGMVNSAYSLNGYPPTQRQTNFGYEEEHSKLISTSITYASQNNPPCPTLFVANLGPNSSEQELTEVFSRLPGFLKLKVQNKNGVPVAFVDFQDVNSATGALNHLQGTILYSSSREGMRLEYPLNTTLLLYFTSCYRTSEMNKIIHFLTRNPRYAKSRMGLRKRGRRM
ncbi:U2 small nuclear ribonucleoprotein B''-like isoform X2 [Canna indica]|uniref:U2 small nuclear ribonucleoprotein B''-like isoform X2 n=1 Tax=Canna indica TaxID=4628 RepID=A0AAQ3KBM6_9LILI|nr:U2 small nuclear ribonucleoprotein B''-like isoform X2 [Canna indica]